MAETYIPLSAAFDALAPFCKACRFSINDKNCICCPHGHTRIKLNTIPPADVRPVEKAEWVSVRDGYGVCSNCNRGDHIDPLARFCRFCGAEMGEEHQ